MAILHLKEKNLKIAMDKKILNYVNQLEGWKTAIKSLHWNAKSLEQHKLCDDIASDIADFQDQVSEVEQSIHGNLPFNQLKGTSYQITNLSDFINDVINESIKMYNSLSNSNDYIGMKSDFESFISEMQRKKYLVNFTEKQNKIKAEARIITKDVIKQLKENKRQRTIDNLISETLKKELNSIL